MNTQLLKLTIFIGLSATVASFSGCGNLPQSVRKVTAKDKEKAAADKLEAEERDRAKVQAEKETATSKPSLQSFPVQLRVNALTDRAEKIKELKDDATANVVITESQKKLLTEKGEVNSLTIEDEIPENLSVVLNLYLEKESDRKEIENSEIEISLEALTEEKTIYSVKVDSAMELKEPVKKALQKAEWILEFKEEAPINEPSPTPSRN